MPTFAKLQRARSPSRPAAAGAWGARGTSLTSRCLQLLSPLAAARTDKLHQENKIQRAEQPQDLAWVVGLRKHPEIKQSVVLLLPWSFPSSKDKIKGWPASGKAAAARKVPEPHTLVQGQLSHKPTLGHEGGSSALQCCKKAGAGRLVEVRGDGMGKSWQRVFGWGCRVTAQFSSCPPAPLQPPHSSLLGSESTEEFGGD